MKKKPRKTHKETPRKIVEQYLGRKLLKGQIPMLPTDVSTCPVPSAHVKDFEECCKDYTAGKISEGDVKRRVEDMLRKLKTEGEHHE